MTRTDLNGTRMEPLVPLDEFLAIPDFGRVVPNGEERRSYTVFRIRVECLLSFIKSCPNISIWTVCISRRLSVAGKFNELQKMSGEYKRRGEQHTRSDRRISICPTSASGSQSTAFEKRFTVNPFIDSGRLGSER